jgi:hypothetical protein
MVVEAANHILKKEKEIMKSSYNLMGRFILQLQRRSLGFVIFFSKVYSWDLGS